MTARQLGHAEYCLCRQRTLALSFYDRDTHIGRLRRRFVRDGGDACKREGGMCEDVLLIPLLHRELPETGGVQHVRLRVRRLKASRSEDAFSEVLASPRLSMKSLKCIFTYITLLA